MTELEKEAIPKAVQKGAQAVQTNAQAVQQEAQAIPAIGPKMADLLVAYLNQLGVEYVFGVPGGAIEPLYDALARSERQGGVRDGHMKHIMGYFGTRLVCLSNRFNTPDSAAQNSFQPPTYLR